ncbi:MAG: hypothetical protein ACTSXH_01055, partial [Promethearchaeota archaeon]
MKIKGSPMYIIIATGYTTHKVLGMKVSKTRAEEDILDGFREAECNTNHPMSVLTSDGWNATQSTIKHLNQEIIHVIHPHEKPYNKAIIRQYSHGPKERKTLTIGLLTDFFKKRGKRQLKYMKSTTNLTPKTKRKRGRPKGLKTK